jgi:hypothetical protein
MIHHIYAYWMVIQSYKDCSFGGMDDFMAWQMPQAPSRGGWRA